MWIEQSDIRAAPERRGTHSTQTRCSVTAQMIGNNVLTTFVNNVVKINKWVISCCFLPAAGCSLVVWRDMAGWSDCHCLFWFGLNSQVASVCWVHTWVNREMTGRKTLHPEGGGNLCQHCFFSDLISVFCHLSTHLTTAPISHFCLLHLSSDLSPQSEQFEELTMETCKIPPPLLYVRRCRHF